MKKRTIRNWGIALILLLLSGIVMLTASAVSNTPQAVDVTLNEKLATSAPTNEISEEELMNIIQSQQPAITAHEEFQENLVWDNELGYYLYPDTFAGAELDKETFQLCVALTDCSEKIRIFELPHNLAIFPKVSGWPFLRAMFWAGLIQQALKIDT